MTLLSVNPEDSADAGHLPGRILYTTPTCRVELFAHAQAAPRGVALVFTPSMNRSLEGNGYGGEVFFRNGFDTVAVKVSDDDWFQKLPGTLLDELQALMKARGYTQRVGYGSSMGGYAAIALSARLGLDAVIAFSPQYCIDQAFDTRWAAQAERLDFVYPITPEAIAPRCTYYVYFDPCDADALHVERLAAVIPPERFHALDLPLAGHPTTHYLFEVGALKGLITKYVRTGRVGKEGLMRERRRSRTYLKNAAERMVERGSLAPAAAMLRQALALDGRDLALWRQLSVVLERLGQPLEAITVLQRVLELRPDGAGDFTRLSHLYAKVERPTEAVAAALRAIELDPDNPFLRGHLSNLYLQAGQLPQALEAIDAALGIDANVVVFETHKCMLLERLGRIDEAIACAERAAALEPANPEPLNQLSHLCARQGRTAEAVRAIERCLTIPAAAGNAFLYGHLSNLHLGAAQLEPALRAIDQAIALDGAVAGFHRHRSVVLERLGRLHDAIDALRRAIECRPAELEYRLQLSHLLSAQGDHAAAAQAAEAVASQPEASAPVLGHWASLLLMADKPEQALSAILRAIALDEHAVAFHRLHAQALLRLNRVTEAAAVVQAALVGSPTDLSLRELAAQIGQRQRPAGWRALWPVRWWFVRRREA